MKKLSIHVQGTLRDLSKNTVLPAVPNPPINPIAGVNLLIQILGFNFKLYLSMKARALEFFHCSSEWCNTKISAKCGYSCAKHVSWCKWPWSTTPLTTPCQTLVPLCLFAYLFRLRETIAWTIIELTRPIFPGRIIFFFLPSCIFNRGLLCAVVLLQQEGLSIDDEEWLNWSWWMLSTFSCSCQVNVHYWSGVLYPGRKKKQNELL